MKIVYNGEMDKRLCKEVLGATIPEILESDPDVIYLDADLMSCIGTLKYGAAHKDRAIDCGIAEANMAGVAIFLSGGYGKNDITVIGTDPGVTAAMNGGTHMPFEDVALYRVIPGSTVLEPSDPTCLKSLLKQAVDQPGIKYIRVGRKSMARIYEDGSEMPIGVAPVLRDGTDVTIFASGIMVHEALQAAASLEQQGISAAVVDCYSIKPLDTDTVTAMAIKTGAAVVAENANRHGGLYSAVLEVLAENCPVPAACVAVEDEFGEVGSQSYLQQRFGLTAAHIEEQAKAVIARK